MIIGIVCVDKNWAIGKNNDLLFHLKKDMQFFRNTTADSIVVCGYNTLLSFPGSKPLKGRSTICLCPNEVERDDCFCIHSFDEMIRLIKELSKTTNVYIIGGAMLYQSMLPYYDKIYVNMVDANGAPITDADSAVSAVYFPNLDKLSNYEIERVFPAIEDEGYLTQLYTYIRKED